MLAWVKKFVLDIMPSVVATVIGAYVVNYYIIPQSPAAASRAAMTSTEAKPSEVNPAEIRLPADKDQDDKTSNERASSEKASFEKAVAEKTAIEKTAEKAAASEPRKPRAAPKPAKTASAPAAEVVHDEARASDLARAAIDRLRGSTSESTKAEPVKAEAPRIQPVSTVASTNAAMQPLPPAINVTTPNPDVFDQGNAAPVIRQPYPQQSARGDDQRRFAPPADIPGGRPLDLRAQASAAAIDRTSIADDVVSTAKSMFHAVIPR